MPDDVVVDLALAEDEPRHAFVIRGRVVDHRLELSFGQFRGRRRRLLQPQQALRGHQDERTRRDVERLLAHEVEILRGGRRVRDPDVLLRSELQESFESRTRMLRPVAFVPMREQEREA